MGALSDERVAQYFNEHFVAAHQQVGSFEVTNQGGVLRKNGGNVASYFCTPDGRVVNAIAGPVPADDLLAAAQWAVEAYAKSSSHASERAQELAKLHHTAADDLRILSRQVGSQVPIHDLLAKEPLPPLNQIYRTIFEQILGQRVSPPDPEVAQVIEAFHVDERPKLPVLVVLYKGDAANIHREWEQVLSRDRPVSQRLRELAECYLVTMLPLNRLAELSQHLGVRPFAAPDGGSPLFVITRSDARQLTAVTTWDREEELVYALAQGAVQAAKEDPRTSDQLTRLLKLVEPIDGKLAQQVERLLSEAGKGGQ